jgi:hypothetical protein
MGDYTADHMLEHLLGSPRPDRLDTLPWGGVESEWEGEEKVKNKKVEKAGPRTLVYRIES